MRLVTEGTQNAHFSFPSAGKSENKKHSSIECDSDVCTHMLCAFVRVLEWEMFYKRDERPRGENTHTLTHTQTLHPRIMSTFFPYVNASALTLVPIL